MEQRYLLTYLSSGDNTYAWFDDEEELILFIAENAHMIEVNEIFEIRHAEDIMDRIMEESKEE